MKSAKAKIKKLEADRKKLLTLFMDNSIDEILYKDRDETIKDELLVARVELSENEMDFSDLEASIAFAKVLFRTPDKFWQNITLEVKKSVQWLFFENGLILEVRTPVNTNAVKHLRVPDGVREHLVEPMGVEPTTFALRTQRSPN